MHVWVTAVVLALGLAVLGRGVWRWIGLAAGLTCGLLLPYPSTPTPLPAAVEQPRLGHATSDTCRACHPREHATWAASFHRTMTQHATPDAVMAPLPATLTARGQTLRLEQQGDRIMAHMLDANGQAQHSRPLALLTGSHHFENYWMAEDDGWFVQFPFLWDLRRTRWIPVSDSFLHPDIGRPEPPAIWNNSCAYCHTVGAAGRITADDKQADSQVAELGIACEACHGPGATHVAAQRSLWTRYRAHLSDTADPNMVQPERLTNARASAVCGQCHSVSVIPDWSARHAQGDAFRPGDALHPTRAVVLPVPPPDGRPGLMIPNRGDPVAVQLGESAGQLIGRQGDTLFVQGPSRTGLGVLRLSDAQSGDLQLRGRMRAYPDGTAFTLHSAPPDVGPKLATAMGWPGQFPTDFDLSAFWNDGTVRTTGREYNGLAASACFTKGEMSCGSCHAMHGAPPADMLTAKGAGDGACIECHADVDAAAHSHHATGSSGARCVNCHQPHTTFGLLGAIRAHRIDSPSAEQSARFGRPNACNLCHLDRTLAWTADALARWYGQPKPILRADDERIAASLLWILNGDAAQRGIVAWALGWAPAVAVAGDDWIAPHLIRLLDDDYAAVRSVAGDVLQAQPAFADLNYDFVAPPAQRRASQTDANRRLSGTRSDATLLLQNGRATPAADRLWHTRDRRPVFISE